MTVFRSIPTLLRGFGFYFGCLLDSDPRYAVAFQLFDGVAAAVVFERVAQAGNLLQAGENESGQGFETGISRNCETVLGFEIANIYRAFEHENRLIFERGVAGVNIEFVFDVSDQLFENGFHWND